MPRILLMGLDGATFDILQPLIDRGRLPNLQAMVERGCSGVLRSTLPPVTPVAWTSLFTGKHPAKHGIYDFHHLDPETYTFETVRADQHREKSLWQLLSDSGRRSIVLDVPFTHPPRPFHGWMITGYGTPRTPGTVCCHPADLRDRLPAALRHQVRVALPERLFDRSDGFVAEWRSILDGRRELLRHLVAEEPWDLFFVVFSVTDNMAHVFWTYVDPGHPNYRRPEAARFREAFFEAHERCDAILGELIERAGSETATFVVSDHGFGSVMPRQYLYRRLLEGEYVTLGRSSSRLWSAATGAAAKAAVRLYTDWPWLREWAKNLKPGGRRAVKRTLRRGGLLPRLESLDLDRSRVLPASFGQRMWIHDRERFPRGPVAAGERRALSDELTDFLLEDRDPSSGRPLVAGVHRGEELYAGPTSHQAPDLLVEYTNLSALATGEDRIDPHVEGGHTPEGILLASGPGVRQARIEGATLVDLAPTLLYLLDEPVPPDMDGRVLDDLVDERLLRSRPVRAGTEPAQHDRDAAPGAARSATEEADIESQLRRLGYL